MYGDTTASLMTDYIITNVTSGTYYKFTYRARNTHGDGPESDSVTILAATVPIQMNAPSIVFNSASLSYMI